MEELKKRYNVDVEHGFLHQLNDLDLGESLEDVSNKLSSFHYNKNERKKGRAIEKFLNPRCRYTFVPISETIEALGLQYTQLLLSMLSKKSKNKR